MANTWSENKQNKSFIRRIVSGKCEWIRDANGKIAILWIYVDDCGLTGNWKDEIYNMEKHLLEKFPGKV